MSLQLQGEVRRLPPRPLRRLVEAVSLWLFVKTLGAWLLRFLLQHRRTFELSAEQGAIRLEIQQRAWGKALSSQTTTLPLEHLSELTLAEAGEDPRFAAGIAGLAVGTFFGVHFLAQGLLTAAPARWLLGGGAVLLLLGVAWDFFLGSGRTSREPRGRAELLIRVQKGRGWVLSAPDRAGARAVFEALSRALSTRRESSARVQRPPEGPPSLDPADADAVSPSER